MSTLCIVLEEFGDGAKRLAVSQGVFGGLYIYERERGWKHW